jgi:hypothetical protein
MARKQGGVTDGEEAIHEVHGNPAVDGEVSELLDKLAAPVAYRSYCGMNMQMSSELEEANVLRCSRIAHMQY